jgi:hypothetical protein
MNEVISLEGPVLKINGELALMIPLEAGGSELVDCSRGISTVERWMSESRNSGIYRRRASHRRRRSGLDSQHGRQI